MDSGIKQICNIIVGNYRYASKKLRYDGDYINHFSALINGYCKKEIPDKKVKEIRSYIKDNTSKMSAFRGDILYILSFLIANDIDIYKSINETLEIFELLVEENFNECEYLILAAYSINKYVDYKERKNTIIRMKSIFNMCKEKYGNLTKEDDYLSCALLAIKGETIEKISKHMESIFMKLSSLNLYSKNMIQVLTNSILLSDNTDVNEISKLIINLEENNLKIGGQFLQLLGVMIKKRNINNKVNLMKDVINYLSSEESEYNFYIDKDFKNMIAFVIVFYNKNDYIDELLALGIYSFLVSKNHGIFNRVLA